jgi:hypothetical protein
MTAQGAESLIFAQSYFESVLAERRVDFENRDSRVSSEAKFVRNQGAQEAAKAYLKLLWP